MNYLISNFKIYLILFFVFVSSFLFFDFCQGAIIYLEPAEGEYSLNDTFIVDIRLDSQGEYINAVEGHLSFPSDILEVKDFSQGNSILTLWVNQPTFSNQVGTISFVGGVPAGYQGVNGLLGRVIFEASQSGQAKVGFGSKSQALLNDGLGTKAVLEFSEANFNVLIEGLEEIEKDEWAEEMEQDKIPPESFEIKISQDPSILEGRYFIAFSTTDKQTGIDYYEIAELDFIERITNKAKWQRGSSPYLLEDQNLKSLIKVKAVDKAGNWRIETLKPPLKFHWQDLLWIILIVLVGLGIIFFATTKLKRKEARNRSKNL